MNKALWVLLFPFMLFAQDKNRFDLEMPASGVSISKNTGESTMSISHENSITGITLLADGYFTIGTSNGLNQGKLDDKCQITFGHPYAMTSYPFFYLDGEYYHPELFFYGTERNLFRSGDTLSLSAIRQDMLNMKFSIINKSESASIILNITLENSDTKAHQLMPGLVLDPALGLWGDGSLFINDKYVFKDTLLQNSIPEGFIFRERKDGSTGLGIKVSTAALSEARVGNWYNLYSGSSSTVDMLYDIAVKYKWKSIELQPRQSVSITLEIELLEPDFPTSIFMRSAIPSYLSNEGNILFPQEINPLTVIYNNGSTIEDIKLKVEEDNYLEEWESKSISVPAGDVVYEKASFTFPEIYSDYVFPAKLIAEGNSGIIDKLTRNILIPAIQVSDTGLTVNIDTVITSGYPKTELLFTAAATATGNYIGGLKVRNISLKENDYPINNFVLERDTTGGLNQADIVFVLDVTGSMSDEINAVKNNIIEFSDSLEAKGIDYRLALTTFLDVVENRYNFTSDVNKFKQWVADQYAHGGGDRPENSLEALNSSLQFDFRPESKKIFIWITDADYHIADYVTSLTVNDVVNPLLLNSVTVHCIGSSEFQTEYYNPIIYPTGGNFYDINGNFRDILLDISNLSGNRRYRLSYNSNISLNELTKIGLTIHYAGLGGTDVYQLKPGTAAAEIFNEKPLVECYPNPFNPVIHIVMNNPYKSNGEITIYNILGERIKTFSFPAGQHSIKYSWHADNEAGMPVSNGIYFVHSRINADNGAPKYLPIQKIVYTK